MQMSGGACNFLGSVSLQRFETTDPCYSSITAQSFTRQAKERTPSRHEARLTLKERQTEERPEAQFWLLFLNVFSLPPEPTLCELG